MNQDEEKKIDYKQLHHHYRHFHSTNHNLIFSYYYSQIDPIIHNNNNRHQYIFTMFTMGNTLHVVLQVISM